MPLNISAGLVPTGGGAWETHDATYGKGGYRSVADITARDAISTLRRSTGMLVHVQSTGATYRMGAGLTNGDWVLESSGLITAGNGLTGTTSFAVLANGTSIEVSASGIRRAALSGAVSAAAGSNVTAFASGDFGALSLATTSTLTLGLPAGSGAGVASAAATGNIRGSRGAYLGSGGTGFQLSVRNNGDTADVVAVAWDSVAASMQLGGSGVTNLDLTSGTNWRLRDTGGTTRHSWTSNTYQGRLTSLTIDSATGADSNWAYAGSGGATGFNWIFTGQPGTTTGGAVILRPGSGTTEGAVDLQTNGGTSRIKTNGTGIGFFNTTPAAQPTDIVALTDSTTGTADNTVNDVGAAFNQATLNNNFADLIAKVNGLRTRLRTLGLMA